MKLKMTKEFKARLRVISAQIAIGVITGSYNFSPDAVEILRTLADEIEAQNSK